MKDSLANKKMSCYTFSRVTKTKRKGADIMKNAVTQLQIVVTKQARFDLCFEFKAPLICLSGNSFPSVVNALNK